MSTVQLLRRWAFGFVGRVRNRHLLAWDAVAQCLAVILAFTARLEVLLPASYGATIWAYALTAPLIRIPLYHTLEMYRRFWRYASLDEAKLIVAAAALGCAVQALLVFQVLVPLGILARVPRSIPFLDLFFSIAMLALPRFLMRMANCERALNDKRPLAGRPQNVLIVGAGDAGCMVLEELAANPQVGLRAVGLVDDDPSKQQLMIRQCRVLGTTADIPDLVRRHWVRRVVIAIPSASGKVIRRLLALCEGAGVETLIVPGIYELLSGQADVRRLRKVQIEDLLRREPVETRRDQVEAMLRGRRVLITGAGGSIGSELCRQTAACGAERLVLLGHGEHSVFTIGKELRLAYPGLDTALVIADIRDKPRLEQVFARFRPEIVFHAAAHKHVSLMEDNIEDAVTNNVLGTRNLLEVAEAFGTAHLVMISSDKAVNPTSVMGATKRLAERLVQDAARHTGRAFVAVRFGNVLGSRGSVVPIFQEQIDRGGPVTVTHPDIKRYFMTIPEAVQLVLQAGALGQGGEVFFLDMGEPIRIVDLACDMIKLSGLQVGKDIDIEFSGLRPGEKLFEELTLDGEHYDRSAHDKIFVCRNGYHTAQEASEQLQWAVDALLKSARPGGRPLAHAAAARGVGARVQAGAAGGPAPRGGLASRRDCAGADRGCQAQAGAPSCQRRPLCHRASEWRAHVKGIIVEQRGRG